MIEGEDFELIPSGEGEFEQAWDVRILKGEYTETVLRFGNIAFDGESDCLNFSFIVISSPSGAEPSEVPLQDAAASILQTILEQAAKDGSLLMGEPEEESED